MKSLRVFLLILLMICASGLNVSCRSRSIVNRKVVFVEPGGVVRTGPDVRGHVWYFVEGQWVISDGPVDIPEGWYATSLDPK